MTPQIDIQGLITSLLNLVSAPVGISLLGTLLLGGC
mgnify:CR=1 FL=1